jgi:hypothetical protein
MIINSRKQLSDHLKSLRDVQDEVDSVDVDMDTLVNQLVQLLSSGEDIPGTGKTPPDFGEEWEPWLTENLQFYMLEAFSIIG